MEELKVGERVVLDIVVTETVTCAGCFFESKGACEVWRKYPCASKGLFYGVWKLIVSRRLINHPAKHQ